MYARYHRAEIYGEDTTGERDAWQNMLIWLFRYAISEELERSFQELSLEGRFLLFFIDFVTVWCI